MPRKFLTIILLFLAFISSNLCYSQVIFEKQYAGIADQVGKTAVLRSSKFFTVSENASGPIGGTDLLLSCYTLNGSLVWSKVLGTANNDLAGEIIATRDGHLLLGAYSYISGSGYEACVYKLDTLGNVIWQRYYGTVNDDYVNGIAETEDGGFIITGEAFPIAGCKSPLPAILHGGSSPLVFRCDRDGKILWNKVYGSALRHGYGSKIIQATDKTFWICGMTESFVLGEVDINILHLRQDGSIIKSFAIGGQFSELGRFIYELPGGDILFGGFSNSYSVTGYNDILLGRMDTSGIIKWSRTYGGNLSEMAQGMKYLSSENKILLCGFTSSFGRGLDGLTIQTDTNGTVTGSRISRYYENEQWWAADYNSTVKTFITVGEHFSSGGIKNIWLKKFTSKISCNDSLINIQNKTINPDQVNLPDSVCNYPMDTISGWFSGTQIPLETIICSDSLINEIPLAVENIEYSLYPNPFEDRLNIRLKHRGRAIFYNNEGVFIKSEELCEGKNELALNGLSPGYYTCVLF